MAYLKPVPVEDADGKPFWDSCRRHAMELQQCARCQTYRFPPGLLCRVCGSDQFDWRSTRGRGTVYSTIVVHQAADRAWQPDTPYNAALIELDEGPRLWSNVTGCQPDEVTIGMPVEIYYDDVTDEVTLPRFQPVRKDVSGE